MLPRVGRIVCLFLCIVCLTACADKTVSVVCEDLTLTLPESYVNLSNKDYADEFDFLYGVGSEAVLGFRYSRSLLEQKFPDISAKKYAQMFVDQANLSCPVTETDGLVSFVYTATTAEGEITYLSAAFMTENNLWIVQFYCPASDYAQKSADFMQYLRCVQENK